MKVYKGWRLFAVTLQPNGELESKRHAASGVRVIIGNRDNDDVALLYPRRDIRNHSPADFNWGYGGSGPAQLALALCVDVLGEEIGGNPSVYQRFKSEFVSTWDNEWEITEAQIKEWYRKEFTS